MRIGQGTLEKLALRFDASLRYSISILITNIGVCRKVYLLHSQNPRQAKGKGGNTSDMSCPY